MFRAVKRLSSVPVYSLIQYRYTFISRGHHSIMGGLHVDLVAPNGTQIVLPTGLFINNEFQKSSSGATITTISPR